MVIIIFPQKKSSHFCEDFCSEREILTLDLRVMKGTQNDFGYRFRIGIIKVFSEFIFYK